MKKRMFVFAFALVLVMALFPQKLGDTVILPNIFLGTSKSSYEKLVRLSVARDETGILQMIYAGEAFVVAEGTRGKVIDSAFLSVEVRILDGKYKGYSGWISRDLVKK